MLGMSESKNNFVSIEKYIISKVLKLIHTWSAIAMAVFLLSPVNKTTFTPIPRMVCTAKFASGLTVSATAIIPVNIPKVVEKLFCFIYQTYM